MTKVKFKVSGESPDIGAFTEGEEREINDALAAIYESRGIVSVDIGVVIAKVKFKKEDK